MNLGEFLLPELGMEVNLLFKLGISVAFVFYIIFAFVIVKQVGKMTETLEVGMEGILKLLSYLHLLFSIMAFAFAFIVL